MNFGEVVQEFLNINPANEEPNTTDMYQFTMAQHGQFSLQIDKIGEGNLQIELLDEQQQLIVSDALFWHEESTRTITQVLAKGNYYIKVSEQQSPMMYQLLAESTVFHLTEEEKAQLKIVQNKWHEWKSKYDGLQWIGGSLTVPYSEGKVHPSAEQDALNMTKMIRYLAGLSTDVTINREYSNRAQAASLVNAINGKLSHYPARPANMVEELYQLGYLGASKSNIGLGYASIVSSIVNGYMADEDPSNIDRVGHRRWILSPYLPEVGFGYFERSTAMYVIGERWPNEIPHYSTIKWPVEGVMPKELFADNDPWSIYLNPNDMNASIDQIRVKLTINGESLELTKANTKDFYLEKSNYGYSAPTLIFRPNDIREIQYGDRYEVEITGITDKAGNPMKIQYSTIFVTMDFVWE